MLALVLVAASVGISNLAAAIGIGAAGLDARTRLRVAAIFGLLEAGMPIVGLLIGHGLATEVGRETRWLAAVLLAAIGAYGIVKALRSGILRGTGSARRQPSDARAVAAERGPLAGTPGQGQGSMLRLLLLGIALSLDNLVAGFALGTYQVNIVTGAVVFGVVSTIMSLAGLEFGARLGTRAGEGGELIGSAVLIGVGIAIGFGALG